MINGTRRHQAANAWGSLVAGAAAALLLAACGGSDGNSGATTTAKSTGTTRAAVATVNTTAPATTAAPATTGAPVTPPPAATTATTTAGYTAEPATGALKKGMKGNRVAAVQTKLRALGYDPGPSDGLFGAKTDTAVRKFQSDQSLAVDGIVGNQTIAALDKACKAKNVC